MVANPLRWRFVLPYALCLSAMILTPAALLAQSDASLTVFSDDAAQDDNQSPPNDGAEAEEAEAVVEQMTWDESLMFEPGRVKNLLEIYYAYLERMRNETGDEASVRDYAAEALQRLTRDKDEQIDLEVFTLSLNSILYHNAQDWSIWINGKRHNRKEALEGIMVATSVIRVTGVSPRKLSYVWTPAAEAYGDVLRRWEERQSRYEELQRNPRVVKNAQVHLDEQERQVSVTLEPNQVFLSGSLLVTEGQRAPASIGATPDAPQESMPAEGGMPVEGLAGQLPPDYVEETDSMAPMPIDSNWQQNALPVEEQPIEMSLPPPPLP